MMTTPKLPWARMLSEGTLIIVSVYLAIFLEGASQDREARSSAHVALVQMLAELREDSADLEEIREEQLLRSKQYVILDQWLASPESIPLDSVAETLDLVFFSNRTSDGGDRWHMGWWYRPIFERWWNLVESIRLL